MRAPMVPRGLPRRWERKTQAPKTTSTQITRAHCSRRLLLLRRPTEGACAQCNHPTNISVRVADEKRRGQSSSLHSVTNHPHINSRAVEEVSPAAHTRIRCTGLRSRRCHFERCHPRERDKSRTRRCLDFPSRILPDASMSYVPVGEAATSVARIDDHEPSRG